MSAAVIPIRSDVRVASRNSARDADTLTHRRLINSLGGISVGETLPIDQRSHALATMWAVERKLPRNQLRCICSTLDTRKDFDLRVVEVEQADAERKAFSAKRDRTRILHGNEAAEAMLCESEGLWQAHWLATVALAQTPAPTQRHLSIKRRVIGSVWLNAEGERYDILRAGIAADEARLTSSKRRA